MQNSPTYRGVLPRTDEAPERVLNASAFWVSAAQVGVLRVTEFDSNGNALGGFNLPAYDYVSNSPTSTTDTFTFKTGGSGGTTVATVAIVYTDSSKNTLSSATKT